jgi:predicted hotdog family 3-hydroxylacyl-ACP dehydratase
MPEQFPEITSVIPHRSTMVLLDRVIALTPDSLCAEVIIDQHNIFFDAATNSVGAWLGIEFMAQAIAAFEGAHSLQRGEEVKVGFLLGSRRYETHCATFSAGTVLHVEAHRVLEHENGLGAFDCTIKDTSQQLLASATVTVFKPDNAHQFLIRSESAAV